MIDIMYNVHTMNLTCLCDHFGASYDVDSMKELIFCFNYLFYFNYILQ